MWTTWSDWRASQPHTVAHWLASIHVLPHNRSAGLGVMAVGALVLIFALAWAGSYLLGVARPSGSEQARY